MTSTVPTTEQILVGIFELAEILGLSVASIRWHIRQNRIRPIRLGRRMLFNPRDVIERLEQLNATRAKTRFSSSLH